MTEPAQRLAGLSAILLGIVLPLALLVATKSSPLVLVLSAASGMAAAVLAGLGGSLAGRCVTLVRSTAGWTSLVLFGFALLSISWAHAPMASVRQFGEAAVPLVAGLLLLLTVHRIAPDDLSRTWLSAAALAGGLIVIDLSTGLWFRELTGGRATDYSYNRALVTLVLFSMPLAALALAERRRIWTLALLPVVWASAIGPSGTAQLAVLVVIGIWFLASWAPRFVAWGAGFSALVAIVIQPFIGTLGSLLLGRRFHEALQNSHSDDRVQIWLSFEAALRQSPWFGHGFGSSLNLQNSPMTVGIPAERITLLGASHPHNAFLQLWVELGVIGALLSAILLALMVRHIAVKVPEPLRPFWWAWFAAISAVAMVSHGAWQAWWIAGIAASAGILQIATVRWQAGNPAKT